MAGFLSSLFGSDSSADTGADGQNAYVPASTLDEGNDDGGTQSAQSFHPAEAGDPGDGGGAGYSGGPAGPPTGAYLEPQSSEGDAGSF